MSEVAFQRFFRGYVAFVLAANAGCNQLYGIDVPTSRNGDASNDGSGGGPSANDASTDREANEDSLGRDAASEGIEPVGDAQDDRSEDSHFDARDAGSFICDSSGGPGTTGPWADWPMPDRGSALHPPAYDIGVPGVVRDAVTGLAWERGESAMQLSFDGAKAYCASLSLGDCRHWRLPTRIELVSIANPGFGGVAIGFPFASAALRYWTSSTSAAVAGDVWMVDFSNSSGGSTESWRGDTFTRVRCVAGTLMLVDGGAPPARYTISNGTVDDNRTGLTWQQVTRVAPADYSTAVQNCTSLNLNGSGWRLPSPKELQTLVDETRSAPAVDSLAFPDTQPTNFVTSLYQDGTIWAVDFRDGTTRRIFFPGIGVPEADGCCAQRCVREKARVKPST